MTGNATGGVLLLVEDDDSIGRLVKRYLEQQDGWRVVWLRSGEEAVVELRRHPVRLVVPGLHNVRNAAMAVLRDVRRPRAFAPGAVLRRGRVRRGGQGA